MFLFMPRGAWLSNANHLGYELQCYKLSANYVSLNEHLLFPMNVSVSLQLGRNRNCSSHAKCRTNENDKNNAAKKASKLASCIFAGPCAQGVVDTVMNLCPMSRLCKELLSAHIYIYIYIGEPPEELKWPKTNYSGAFTNLDTRNSIRATREIEVPRKILLRNFATNLKTHNSMRAIRGVEMPQ